MFGWQRVLGDAVTGGTARPALPSRCKGCEKTLCSAPIHDVLQLIPVIDLFKGQVLHRRAGDDQSIKFLVADLIKGLVKSRAGALRGCSCSRGWLVRSRVISTWSGELPKQAQQLGFGGDLGRHQVEDGDLQRADILVHRAVFTHHKDIFAVQSFFGGQCIGDDLSGMNFLS